MSLAMPRRQTRPPADSPVPALIKELRDKKGLTQSELAEATGLHRVTIARIETDTQHGMDVNTATRLAPVLGVRVSELLDVYAMRPEPAWLSIFRGSKLFAALSVTDDEIRWLRSLPDGFFGCPNPSPSRIAKLILWKRENGSGE